ncbi:MAG: MarR family winged helix-turn-helix transcriptional regulator [Dyella sp.]|uniref:MarR family winged helix-turn-helix transcriptional regulator n=1 Tax=Dyella sp. TaxID=1869338 RepID=UPI003F7CEA07
MDEVRKLGGVGLGARLRRLSEAIDGDATRAYSLAGIPFEQRWFGVLNQLALNGPATVSELAARLRITHVSVSQTRHSLIKAGLIAAQTDETDARRRPLVLTAAGRRLVTKLQPLWRAMEHAAAELAAESGDLMACLDLLDDALTKRPLLARVKHWMEREAAKPAGIAEKRPASRGNATGPRVRAARTKSQSS